MDELAMLASFLGVFLMVCVFVVPVAIGLGEKRRTTRETLHERPSLTLTCPRCEVEQTMRAGGGTCRGCRRPLLIEIEEPRCECGYLLFRLASPTCPECGRAVESSIA